MKGEFIPLDGQKYWYIDSYIEPQRSWFEDDDWQGDKERVSSGNCFRTQKECQIMCGIVKNTIKMYKIY